MLFTTTQTLTTHEIATYHGVVTGEVIVGVNVFKDIFSNIRDIIGGRAGAYEKELEKARQVAFKEVEDKAAQFGADAVIAIDIDYQVIGETGSMLMISVSGTAVSFSR